MSTAAPRFRRATGPRGFEAARLTISERLTMCQDLLGEFGATNVTLRGDELVHSCCLPWHDDTHPSAKLNYRKLTYVCFGCGSGGGLLWFIATCRDTNTDGAAGFIHARFARTHETRPVNEFLHDLKEIYAGKVPDVAPPMPHYSRDILKPWKLIHPYLTAIRGIPESNIVALEVGYDPERQRIVFPHFWMGSLVGWQSRRIWNDGTAKYLNTPDFPKSQTLYNHIPRGPVVVVESPMSVLAKAHLSVHMEATFGALVTARQLHNLARHEKIILFFDNDEAGWEATHRVAAELGKYGPVWVVPNPYDADAADMCDGTFLRLVHEAVPYSVWHCPSKKDLVLWPETQEVNMGITKHGNAEKIIKDDEDAQGVTKESARQWDETDDEELREENSR